MKKISLLVSKSIFAFLIVSALCANSILAQQTVTGTVKDEKTASVAGVSVLLKGTTKGVLTNSQGKFSIDVLDKNAVLVFSFIGFQTKEIVVGQEKDLSITLITSNIGLDEVTVIGSRSKVARTKTDTPTPVDVISSKELAATGQTEMTQMINFVAPSFNSARQTIANGTDHRSEERRVGKEC